MAYWVGYWRTGQGEITRVGPFDSIVKARKRATTVLKTGEYHWAAIYSGKDKIYHKENIEFGPGRQFITSKYDSKSRYYISYIINSDGTLGGIY